MTDWLLEYFKEFEDYLGLIIILVLFLIAGVIKTKLKGDGSLFDDEYEWKPHQSSNDEESVDDMDEINDPAGYNSPAPSAAQLSIRKGVEDIAKKQGYL